MLDTVVPITWKTSAGHLFGKPSSELPRELDQIFQPDFPYAVRRSEACPSCAIPSTRLNLGWLYPGDSLLFDCSCGYCVNCEAFYLSATDVAELKMRRSKVASGGLSTLLSKRSGIGNTIRWPSLGAVANTALAADAYSIQYCGESNSAVTDSFMKVDLAALPQVAVFHTVEHPEQMSLKVELTTKCNFRCDFCYGRQLTQGFLKFEQYVSILEALPPLAAVELVGEGESLLHPEFFRFLSEASTRGLWTHVTTNGSSLTKASIVRLLKCRLSSIAISIESLDPQRFAKLRKGGRLENVLAGIAVLENLRRRHDSPLKTMLWVTILRETLPEIVDIVTFAKNAGIDEVEYQLLNPMNAYRRFYGPELIDNLITLDELRSIVANVETHPVLREVLSSVAQSYRSKTCDVFMTSVMTNWEGSVSPCCLLKVPDFPALGDLTTGNFNEIWNRPHYRAFRFALQHGIVPDCCRGCARTTESP